MRNAQAAIAAQLPHGRLVTLPGQTHMVKAKPTTPVLLDHFGLAVEVECASPQASSPSSHLRNHVETTDRTYLAVRRSGRATGCTSTRC